MLTLRGRCLALLGFAGTLLGVLRAQDRLTLISLTILVWLFLEWVWFRWRFDIQLSHVQVRRTINGSPVPPKSLFTGRRFDVAVQIESRIGGFTPVLLVEDVLTENFKVESGEHHQLVLTNHSTLELNYSLSARGLGEANLPGVSIKATDYFGIMSARKFIPCRQSFVVLPSFVDIDEVHTVKKRFNSLPPPGVHRLQRAGMGSELLELREYTPGDPPKSIAWKVSARRDRLMTRVYESEVPVRTVLFLDTSISTRVGGFGSRLIDQLTTTAASIARSAITMRDPVGLIIFNEQSFRRIDPKATEGHFYRLLKEMTKLSSNSSPPSVKINPALLEIAWQHAQEQHPELLDHRISLIPFTWFPILPGSIRQWNRRYRLSVLLSELRGLRFDQTIQLALDDSYFSGELQKYLMDAGYAWLEPTIERRGRGFHDCMAKMGPLHQAMMQALARSRDNESYVILIDLIDCAGELDKILPVVRSAVARHHRVTVICPTPDFRRPIDSTLASEMPAEQYDLLMRAEQLRLNQAADHIRRRLRRAGASVSFSADQNAIRLVLAEADLARHGRTTHTGGR